MDSLIGFTILLVLAFAPLVYAWATGNIDRVRPPEKRTHLFEDSGGNRKNPFSFETMSDDSE